MAVHLSIISSVLLHVCLQHPGIFVGLRYNAPDLNGPSGGGGGGGGFGRRSGKWASLTMAAAGAPVMDTHRMLELRSECVVWCVEFECG